MAVQGDRDDAPGAGDFQQEALGSVTVPVLTRDIVVVGASAGGVEALTELVRGLPPDFPAAILIVLHVMPTSSSMLPSILDRRGPLPVTSASDGERIEGGHIYVAPPDHHMLVDGEAIRVTHGPREDGHRPAVDPLFRSAAEAFGPRVIGIVLSGALHDGTAGLGFIKRAGGIAIAQDLDEAAHRDMPASACRHVDVDHVVRVRDMPELIAGLLQKHARSDRPDA